MSSGSFKVSDVTIGNLNNVVEGAIPIWNSNALQSVPIDSNLNQVGTNEILVYDGSQWTYGTQSSDATALQGVPINSSLSNVSSGDQLVYDGKQWTYGTPAPFSYTPFTAFVPTVLGSVSAGVGTYTSQQGYYTKIGVLVTINAEVVWTSHTGSGDLQMDGLPFACRTATNYSPEGIANPTNIPLPGGVTSARCMMNSGTSIINFFCVAHK